MIQKILVQRTIHEFSTVITWAQRVRAKAYLCIEEYKRT